MSTDQHAENLYGEERHLIQRAEREKRLVFFVGAGVSVPSGMPLWSTAISEIKTRMKGDLQDDALKIPQYYYIQHGECNYNRLMKDIFKYQTPLFTNDIHRELFKFQVRTIITTNYDHLLEDAAKENYRVCDVISQDSDLPYGFTENKIIKMHGDFEHNNFVLKEDDYLHYEQNFRLLTAYIKALIAENTIIFIGYSFNDPDLKQIFSWVKEVLGHDMPRSYMIVTKTAYSEADANYFKNFGIKVLYANMLWEGSDHAEQMVRMLQFLREKEGQTVAANIYDALKPLRDLNYLHRRYIEQAFWGTGIFLDNNKLVVIENTGFRILNGISFFGGNVEIPYEKDVSDEDKGYYKEIYGILAKSSVYWYVRDEKGKIKEIIPHMDGNTSVDQIRSAIMDYDMSTLKKLRQRNESMLAANSVLYMEQARLSYDLGEYVEAYRYLQRGTNTFYQQGKYNWYFISLINRKYLARIIDQKIFSQCSEEEQNEIRQDAEAIDLDKIYYSLPDMENGNNIFLRELYTFQVFYSSFLTMQKKAEEALKESRTSYFLFSKMPAIAELRQYVIESWNYLVQNFILLDQYIEFSSGIRQYARSLLMAMTVSHMEDGGDMSFGDAVGNIQPEPLDSMDIYFVLRYLPLEDLQFIFSQSEDAQVSIDDDGISRLEHILSNLPDINVVERNELFEKILYLSCHTCRLPSLISDVLQALVNHVGNIARRSMRMAITVFFACASQCEERADDENDAVPLLHEFIEQLLAVITRKLADLDDIGELLEQALILQKKLDHDGAFESQYVSTLLEQGALEALCILYPYMDDDTKTRISVLAQREEWNFANLPDRLKIDAHDLNLGGLDEGASFTKHLERSAAEKQRLGLFCSLLCAKILQSNKDVEENLLAVLPNVRDDRKDSSPSSYKYIFSCVTNAYLADAFVEKARIRECIRKSNIAELAWVVDWKNDDYANFQCGWLAYCPEALLQTMARHEKVREQIQKMIQKEYLNGTIKKNILRIYFSYFAKENISDG